MQRAIVKPLFDAMQGGAPVINVLIVDDNQDFCQMVEEYVERQPDMDVVGCFHEGSQALTAVRSHEPDVLLLDLVMPASDGVEVLEAIRELGEQRPKVIMMSAFGQESFVSQANELGVDFYLMKPFRLETLVRRIRQVAASDLGTVHSETERMEIKKCLAQYFSMIGVPSHYKGYRYLLEAVSLVVQDASWLDGVTKELYPAIGEKFGTSPTQVERAIRHAIETTWANGDPDAWRKELRCGLPKDRRKPTNSSFIAKMADVVRLDLNIYHG